MSDLELFNQAMNEYKIQKPVNTHYNNLASDFKDATCLSDSILTPTINPTINPIINTTINPIIKKTIKTTINPFHKITLKQVIRCSHINISLEKGINVCLDCGEEINKKIQHTKEWRYYGPSDGRHSSDPNRVQIRKSDERSIFKDVENMGFSDKIIREANKIYFQVTNNRIYRGNSRKAIVFACIFHSYKLSGKPQSHDKLIHVFDLTRKTGLKGLKHVSLYAPKNSSIRTTYITPINLVDETMDQFQATKEQKIEVASLYNQIKNKSSRLNRSRPQSVSSGLIYYWIRKHNKDITLKQFTEKVALSELTINKIAKEISEVLGTPEIL
jgi:transcription initiation factor TFIIIB Brf1 subunit/transcription initiation factor TFIIB